VVVGMPVVPSVGRVAGCPSLVGALVLVPIRFLLLTDRTGSRWAEYKNGCGAGVPVGLAGGVGVAEVAVGADIVSRGKGCEWNIHCRCS